MDHQSIYSTIQTSKYNHLCNPRDEVSLFSLKLLPVPSHHIVQSIKSLDICVYAHGCHLTTQWDLSNIDLYHKLFLTLNVQLLKTVTFSTRCDNLFCVKRCHQCLTKVTEILSITREYLNLKCDIRVSESQFTTCLNI